MAAFICRPPALAPHLTKKADNLILNGLSLVSLNLVPGTWAKVLLRVRTRIAGFKSRCVLSERESQYLLGAEQR